MAERQVASRQIPTTTTINEAENTAQTKYQMTSDEDFAGVSDKSSNETKEDYDLDYLNDTGAKDLPFRLESEDSTQKLVNYIEEKMKYFNNKLTFASAGINPPTPYEIQMAFSTWVQTSFSINAMYEFAQTDADNAEAELDQYIKIKKSEVRTKYNKIDAKKSSWLSATDIEATVHSVYKNDIAKLEAKAIELRREASYLKGMQKTWENYLWVLRSLKDMSMAEMNGMRFTPDLRRGDEHDLM